MVDYRLNEASFASLGWGDAGVPANVERTISYAIQHWTAYAGARRVYRYVGPTTLTGWQVFQPIIVAAKPGCSPKGCDVAAHMQDDKEMIFWSMNSDGGTVPRWSVGSTPGTSLAAIASHEIGHDLLRGFGQDDAGHIMNRNDGGMEQCLLHAFGYSPDLMGFCERELLAIGRNLQAQPERLTGPGYCSAPVLESITSSLWPPTLPAPTVTQVTAGLAGTALVHGTDVFNPNTEWRLLAGTKVLVSAGSLPPVAVNPSSNAWEATPIPASLQRPSTLFDPYRNTMWTVVRVGGATAARMKLYRNILGTPGWEDMGILSHPSIPVESRYPPGLAIDHRTQNIVITWTSSTGGNPHQDCHFGPAFHCTNEVLAGIITPTAVAAPMTHAKRFVLGPPSNRGYSGLGTPTVVCDPDLPLINNQCEVYVVNRSQWKEILNWRFCVDSSGFCGFSIPYSERSNSPGETDYPIAVAGRRGDGTGRIVQVVVGTDKNLWWRTKATVSGSFPGWQGPVGPMAVGAAAVVNSNIFGSFTVAWPRQ